MAQVREVAGALIRGLQGAADVQLLVGTSPRTGAIAGPRLLEHLVDVVLSFEGDRTRRLAPRDGAFQNRTDDPTRSACFELHDEGNHGPADRAPCS